MGGPWGGQPPSLARLRRPRPARQEGNLQPRGHAGGLAGLTRLEALNLSHCDGVAPELRRHYRSRAEVEAAGQAVAVVDGKIVENLHVETAKALLARAEAIARLEAEAAA